MQISIDDLVAASKNFVVTDEYIERAKKRLDDMNKRFEQEAKDKQLPEGWLHKEYTL